MIFPIGMEKTPLENLMSNKGLEFEFHLHTKSIRVLI